MRIYEKAETFDLPDPRVWVAGDWHGNGGWVQTLLPAMRRHDALMTTVLQLGDYGFPQGNVGVHSVDYWAKRAGLERVLVTLGNHEAWGAITPALARHPGQAIRVSEVVWLLPQPFRFQIMGREVLSLGGASSVDKRWRTPGKDWWADELINERMAEEAIAGGPADVLLTHESPATVVPEVAALLARNPHGFPPDALAVSAAQRELVERVRDATTPQIHLHGHMHVYGDLTLSDGRQVVSVNRDTMAGSAGVLDIASLEFEPLPLVDIRRW